jgi:prevent-host-death family protein
MEIGVREAKAHLSQYLHRVQSGEEFVITDHGKPVARLTPIDSPIEFPPGVAKGIREGWIRQPTRRGPLLPFGAVLGVLPEGITTWDLINEDRGDE